MRAPVSVAAVLALVLVACGSEGLFDRGEPLPDVGGGDGGTGTTSFKDDIEPIFASSCTGCHSGGAGGLVLTGVTSSDYPNVVTRVNGASPAQSLIYTKPTGLVSHGGGTILPSTGAAAQKILAWCQQGAPNN